MSNPPAEPPPPRRSFRGTGPPPPGRAQALVARSGFVVYEGGRSIFDESVLVYLSRHRRQWPDFDVVDHVGRGLGATRLQSPRGLFLTRGRSAVFDPGGSKLLTIRPGGQLFKFTFDISGVATGDYSSSSIRPTKLFIEANNERFGAIIGSGLRWIHNRTLTVVDHDDRPVGAIRTFRHPNRWSAREDYVLSIDPALKGELRRLLIAAPTVVAKMRRAQQQSS